MIALLALPAARWALAVGLLLAVAIGGIAWLRWDAARDAAAHMAARAAHNEERTRHNADAAARDADRDGASERMRSGGF